MSDFLERLKQEEKELSVKAIKLQEFTLTNAFQELSDANQILLHKQLEVMSDYIGVLVIRIELNQN